jgi:hypothetical protein
VVLAVLAASVALPASRPFAGARSLDAGGALTATAGISLLVYAVIEAPAIGWLSTRTVAVLAAAGLVLVAFVRIEAGAAAPLLPRRLARASGLRAANGASALMMGAMFRSCWGLRDE